MAEVKLTANYKDKKSHVEICMDGIKNQYKLGCMESQKCIKNVSLFNL